MHVTSRQKIYLNKRIINEVIFKKICYAKYEAIFMRYEIIIK